jgi:hypothetical protein
LPEIDQLSPPAGACAEQSDDSANTYSNAWRRVMAVLERLARPSFPQALAAMLREVDPAPDMHPKTVERACRRWRLSVDELKRTRYLVVNEPLVRRASRQPWPTLQRVLTTDGVGELLSFAEAVAKVVDGGSEEIDFCRDKLQLAPEALDPDPLITGDDLIEHGLPPGKAFRMLLETVREAQLLDQVRTKSEALEMAQRLWEQAQGRERD